MPKFRKKPVVIEAFRFGIDGPHQWWRSAVDSGKAFVFEKDGQQYAAVSNPTDMTVAARGQYIVNHGRHLSTMSEEDFGALYEPAEPHHDQ